MKQAIALCVALLLAPLAALRAGDWPTYRHDIQRSGVTAERLDPAPVLLCQQTPQHAPRTSTMAAASTDYWHKLTDLTPRAAYDRAFHVVTVGEPSPH